VWGSLLRAGLRVEVLITKSLVQHRLDNSPAGKGRGERNPAGTSGA